MTTSLKDKVEQTIDNMAGAGTSNRIEGRSKELLGRVLEELGEWLEQPQTVQRGTVQRLEGKLQQYAGEDQERAHTQSDSVVDIAKDRVEDVVDEAKEAAADTARRLKEIF